MNRKTKRPVCPGTGEPAVSPPFRGAFRGRVMCPHCTKFVSVGLGQKTPRHTADPQFGQAAVERPTYTDILKALRELITARPLPEDLRHVPDRIIEAYTRAQRIVESCNEPRTKGGVVITGGWP